MFAYAAPPSGPGLPPLPPAPPLPLAPPPLPPPPPPPRCRPAPPPPTPLLYALAELEGARSVKLFPSGLAAITGALSGVLKAGDDILVTDAAYRPTRRFCDNVLRRFGVSVRYYLPRTSPDELLAMATPAWVTI